MQQTYKSNSFPAWVVLSLTTLVIYTVFSIFFMSSFHVEVAKGDHIILGSSLSRRTREEGPTTKAAPISGTKSFEDRMIRGEEVLQRDGPDVIRKVITAFLEQPMNDIVKGTGSRGDLENDKDPGTPPEFVIPLPLRTTKPEDLKKYEYHSFRTCHDMPAGLPVDRGLVLDDEGQEVISNIGNDPKPDDYHWQQAPYCPVDADPFLPWIHDIFPSLDGSRIEFVAQNRRRCDTGKLFSQLLERRAPQVAIMQPISVERISEEKAMELAPELWSSGTERTIIDNSTIPRYRLAPFQQADPDAQYTRFICRFHGMDFSSGKAESVIVGETLSEFPFNYEFVAYRKARPLTMLTPKGKDTTLFWMSNFRFHCPVPQEIQSLVASSGSILSDGTPTMHVELIPMRTSPRYGIMEVYFKDDLAGPQSALSPGSGAPWFDKSLPIGFDPKTRWGDRNVMPRVEASGRWSNLPICHAPQPPEIDEHSRRNAVNSKPHLLSACLWASMSYQTRGNRHSSVIDTEKRVIEWIEFHLMVGFDHIYVYDNSGAHSNTTSLEAVLKTFPSSQVTRIEWPAIPCNNNIPAHDSTGERSSQYAAENSCRTRHAPFTEWIASFDTDEYLVPMGKYESLRDVVTDAGKKGTNILSFRSSRAKLMHSTSIDVNGQRFMMDNLTFLEAYNCDSSSNPKPKWADRARKQLYRTDYVLYHFVHYSTVTKGIITPYSEGGRLNWNPRYGESPKSERTTDEVNEAVMLHAKTTTSLQTSNWVNRCHYQFEKKWRGCYVGFPWPDGVERKEEPHNHNEDGMEYNCFPNEKISEVWLPKLKEALRRRKADQP